MFKQFCEWVRGLFQPREVEEEDLDMQCVLAECLRSGQVVTMRVEDDGTRTMTKYPLEEGAESKRQGER